MPNERCSGSQSFNAIIEFECEASAWIGNGWWNMRQRSTSGLMTRRFSSWGLLTNVCDIRKSSYKFKVPSRTSTILHKQLFRGAVREKLSTFFMRKARRHEPSLLLWYECNLFVNKRQPQVHVMTSVSFKIQNITTLHNVFGRLIKFHLGLIACESNPKLSFELFANNSKILCRTHPWGLTSHRIAVAAIEHNIKLEICSSSSRAYIAVLELPPRPRATRKQIPSCGSNSVNYPGEEILAYCLNWLAICLRSPILVAGAFSHVTIRIQSRLSLPTTQVLNLTLEHSDNWSESHCQYFTTKVR